MTTSYTTFYIVRHGETEWNVQGILQGQTDAPLTENGINQAKAIGKELEHIHFDGIFSSDLFRAHRTAQLMNLERKMAIKTTQLLRERNFGKWEGKPYTIFTTELKHLLDEFLSLPDDKKFTYRYPDTESDEELVVRCLRFLRETAVAYPHKTFLVTTHGGIIRSLLIHLGYGTYVNVHPHSIGNTAYVKLETDGVDCFIKETKRITLSVKE